MEQLQSLKHQLLTLKKVVEQQIEQHEATAAEQAKLIGQLQTVLDWLYEREAQIQSRPLLHISVDSVYNEMKLHEVINRLLFLRTYT